MKILRGSFIGVLSAVSVLAVSSAFAQSNTIIEKLENKESKSAKKLNVATSVDVSTNLLRNSSYAASQSLGISFLPSYTLSEKFKVSSNVSISNELKNNTDVTVNNIPVKLSYKSIKLSKGVLYRPSVSAYIPTNEVSREDGGLYTSVAIGQGISFSSIKGTKLSGSLGLGVKSNFHKYTRDSNNQANIKYSLTPTGGLSYGFTDDISLSASMAYGVAYTYQGAEKLFYQASQSLNYQINKKMSVSVYHSNGGSSTDYDGSANVKVFDELASEVGVSFTVIR
ncbi:MAG: hypothetical protein HOO06_13150 [Bdellovibrionaceae bacterium]|jgi:hypothetical protein|nr:hypothetical protein [Pseudobdellovibrionaceae bacterium]